MPISVRDGGTWKQSNMFVRDAGVWKPVQQGFVRDAGVWKSFYTAEVVVTAPTSLNLQGIGAIFNNYEAGLWGSTKKKRLIVNSHIGPLQAGASFGGTCTIEITPNGSVSGLGGAAGTSGVGGNGGPAFNIFNGTGYDIINNGIIRGGGGGGGLGGTGGAGQIVTREPSEGYTFSSSPNPRRLFDLNDGWWLIWEPDIPANQAIYIWPIPANVGDSVGVYDDWEYFWGPPDEVYTSLRKVARQSANPTYTEGGVGGVGGRGQGVDGSAASGALGAPGGTNAGTGGTGGTGGAYGMDGARGSTGEAGSAGPGDLGITGGAPGASILGYNRVTYSGSGTLIGPTVNN